MAKKSLKERLKKKRIELAKKGSKGGIIFLKEGTRRIRVLPVGEENEFAIEVTQFYLGSEIKGVFSPSTFGEPCAIMEAYQELKDSKDKDDQDLAKQLIPKTKYLMPVLVYEDLKGKKVDEGDTGKLVQLTNGIYSDIIDYYLDEDEWGDMTDAKLGYDLKLTREGTTMTNTEYSVQPCKNTPLPKKYRKEIDINEMVKKHMPDYEETKDKIEQFLGVSSDSKPKKKNKIKKRRRKKDI